MMGLVSWSPDGHQGPAKKPTGFMTNSEHIGNRLSLRCDGTHDHVPLVGGRAAAAAIYPTKLCTLICEGLKDEIRDREEQMDKYKAAFALVQRPQNGKWAAKGHKFPTCTILDVGFSTSRKIMDLAIQHQVHKQTILRATWFCCAMFLQMQLLLLGLLMWRAAMTKPVFVMARLAFDETGMRLRMAEPGMSDAQASNVWQIMCARMVIHAAWANAQGGLDVYRAQVVFPPLLVVSVSAANMWYALRCHPHCVRIWVAVQFLLAKADFSAFGD